MPAVVYDVVHDNRIIKKRENMVKYCAAIGKKISRFRSTLPYLSSEYRNLRHIITADNLNSDHFINSGTKIYGYKIDVHDGEYRTSFKKTCSPCLHNLVKTEVNESRSVKTRDAVKDDIRSVFLS